jgi:putative redox protein
MGDWRELEAVWQGNNLFIGRNKAGLELVMGSPNGFSPMELLLIGLAGCTGMDVASILEKKRQPLHAMKVITRGLRRDENPRVYTEIEVEFLLYGRNLDAKAVEQAIALSQNKYCSVSAMLGPTAPLHTSYKILSEEDVTLG